MTLADKIKCLWYYAFVRAFAAFFYDEKYLKGKYFCGKRTGILSVGWKWVYYDTLARLFTGKNKNARYPIGYKTTVINPQNISFHIDDINNMHSPGAYYQAIGKICIGKGSYIAPNVGLITSNHDVDDLDKHTAPKNIKIGKGCWIGMNSVILPGVTLGDKTIVGAGAVVTKSFEHGHCVIAGNPARVIRRLNR